MENRIIIFDTTLRDGEQTPGVNLNIAEKVEIAKGLEALGVDIIEAGFPATSVGDFEAVQAVSRTVSCSVAALARCVTSDIDRALEALADAKAPRLHIFIATSDIHIEYKLKSTREQVLQKAVEAITYAKEKIVDIEFSCEDASRSDPAFLYQMVEAAIQAGATTINIPDTVGYAIPTEFGRLIANIRRNVPSIDKAVLSVHCHDDLGLAVANTIAALEHGARQAEVTINGIGERAGNAALEEVVMAANTRADYLELTHSVVTTQIYRTSQRVAALTGIAIPLTKAIVGENAFAHESGIHQHGMLANPMTYEIMTPESVGKKESSLVLGKHSGRHAFKDKVEALGYTLGEDELNRAFTIFKELADRKKNISDEDIEALISHKSANVPESYILEGFQIQSSNKMEATANIVLQHEGERISEAATGAGPIDAAFNALVRMVKQDITLQDYRIDAVTGGEDALGEVVVRVEKDGKTYTGKGLAPDIIEASIYAFVNAINRMSTV